MSGDSDPLHHCSTHKGDDKSPDTCKEEELPVLLKYFLVFEVLYLFVDILNSCIAEKLF